MKLAISAFCLLALTGCVTGPALDPALPMGPPSTFNADPDRYDRQQVYVQGYLATLGHWWQFNFYEDGKQFAGKFCLNIDNIDWLAAHRSAMNGRHVVLKGVFRKGAWANALGGCDRNDNGLFIDEDFLKKRYRYQGE